MAYPIFVLVVAVLITPDEMYRLASKLDISREDVDASFDKFCGNEKAAIYDILTTWWKSQNSREKAYVKLAKALVHPDVGLNLVAREVMGYRSTKKSNQLPSKHYLRFKASGLPLNEDHLEHLSCRLNKEEMYRLGQRLRIPPRQMDASFMKILHI